MCGNRDPIAPMTLDTEDRNLFARLGARDLVPAISCQSRAILAQCTPEDG